MNNKFNFTEIVEDIKEFTGIEKKGSTHIFQTK